MDSVNGKIEGEAVRFGNEIVARTAGLMTEIDDFMEIRRR